MELKAGDTVTVNGLPVGSVVKFSEVDPVEIAGGEWATPVISPKELPIVDGVPAEAAVTVTNTFNKAGTGTFNLHKKLVGVDKAKFPKGTTFPVTATYTVDGVKKTETFQLPANGDRVNSGLNLPAGTVVTLTEGKLPAAPKGYVFVSNKLSAATITIEADGNPDIAWSVTNTYKEGGLAVTGMDATGPILAGALLLLAGGAALVFSRRKRKAE